MRIKNVTTIVGLTLLTLAASAAQAAGSASSRKSGQLHLTKECPTYTGAAGDHCTITASDFDPIAIGSTISYDQAAGTPAGLLDANVVLDGGSGNRAVGRCTLDLGTGTGLCTFSDGTGRFTGFQARLDVACGPTLVCSMDGTYSFSSKD
jgi:hypothetical protein